MEKTEKKGFWGSLFSPKPYKCSKQISYDIDRQNVQPTADSSEIKILGPGCAKCKSVYSIVEKVIKENNLDLQLTKVNDIEEIMKYNIISTPAIVYKGEVVMKGKVPTEKEVKHILGL